MTQISVNPTNQPEADVRKELEILLSKLTDRERAIIYQIISKGDGYRTDIMELYDVVVDFLSVLGLLTPDRKALLPELVSGEEKPTAIILKSVMDIVTLMGQASVPVLGRSAEKKLEEKFSFVKKVVPMIKNYSERYGTGK